MQDDVILNKFETIKKCLSRTQEEYAASKDFLNDYTRQDAAVLNLERAAQIAIDVASHIVRLKKLGLPKKTSDVFEFLQTHLIISKNTEKKMKNMVGFRNIVVHEYQKLDTRIVISVIQRNLQDFEIFMEEILKFTDH